MRKIADVEETQIIVSPYMVNNIKNDILKYKNFYDFCVSVGVMRKNKIGDYIAFEFDKKDIEKYQQTIMSKYVYTGDDSFVFPKIAKKMRKDDSGKYQDTNMFVPLNFFAYVYKMIKNDDQFIKPKMTATEFLTKYPDKKHIQIEDIVKQKVVHFD